MTNRELEAMCEQAFPPQSTMGGFRPDAVRIALALAMEVRDKTQREFTVEEALLQARIRTMYLVYQHPETVGKAVELYAQSKQYVEHAVERERKFGEIERDNERLRFLLSESGKPEVKK